MAMFQGVGSSRLVLNRMTARHLQIHVKVTSAPGVPRLVPSAFMSQQNVALSTQSLPAILWISTLTHRFRTTLNIQNIQLTVVLGAIIEFPLFEYVSIRPSLQQRSLSSPCL